MDRITLSMERCRWGCLSRWNLRKRGPSRLPTCFVCPQRSYGRWSMCGQSSHWSQEGPGKVYMSAPMRQPTEDACQINYIVARWGVTKLTCAVRSASTTLLLIVYYCMKTLLCQRNGMSHLAQEFIGRLVPRQSGATEQCRGIW